MKFVICPDSFKESLSSKDVSLAIRSGLSSSFPNAEYDLIPLSDGGEGFIDVLVESLNGNIEHTKVIGPLGDEIPAKYGYIAKEKKAIIEIAEACGLTLVPKEFRNPSKTTTYGVGQLILNALNKGAVEILVGLGGSSTNDGGLGMFIALGAKALDENGIEIKSFSNILSKVKSIDISSLDKRLSETKIEIACDVKNPLLGENGATHIFSPQKGADESMVLELEESMKNYNEIIEKAFFKKISNMPGSGAAGGLGYAFCALGYNLINGIDLVLRHSHFEERIKDCDFIITGEGAIDEASINGKVISGVSSIARKYDKPVIAFTGKICDKLSDLYEIGVTSIFSITDSPKSLDEALKSCEKSLKKASLNLGRLILRAYKN